MSENFGNELDTELEDEFDDDDDPNRITGATARAVCEYVARHIVEDPDSVSITAIERGRSISLELHAAPDDLGRLIGRRGRVAQSLRTVVRAAGARDGVDVGVEIVD